MNVAILAGGDSRRFFGINKALLPFGTKTLIENIISTCQKVFDKILIVVKNDQQLAQFIPFSNHKVTIVKDLILQKSSLSGIYSAILCSNTYFTFVLAADMPFVNPSLLKYMINTVQENLDIIIPRLNNRSLPNKGYETLHAIYSKRCASYIEEQIKKENPKIINFFKYVKVREIKEEIVRKFDPQLLSFFNINTYKDYQQAVKILNYKGGYAYDKNTIRFRNSPEYQT